MSKNKLEKHENVEVAPENFYITLNSSPTDLNKNNVSTNFTNTLYTPLFLKGYYEMELESIIFSKVDDIDLGSVSVYYLCVSHLMTYVYSMHRNYSKIIIQS